MTDERQIVELPKNQVSTKRGASPPTRNPYYVGRFSPIQ